MTRIFGRHELKQAILEVLDDVGPANGYALMQALGDRVGPSWRPSPGAIYPALLALEEVGLVEGQDDGSGRVYALADAGRFDVARHAGTLERVAARAREKPQRQTLGGALDAFAAAHPMRRSPLDDDGSVEVAAILTRAADDISKAITTTRGTT